MLGSLEITSLGNLLRMVFNDMKMMSDIKKILLKDQLEMKYETLDICVFYNIIFRNMVILRK